MTSDPDLARGLDLLRARAWFEAHEALEDAWRRAAGPRRTALQGLVHVAVALEHLRRGNAAGLRLQWAKALARAGPVDGFDPGPWLAELQRWLIARGWLEGVSSEREPELPPACP